jgi:hypothetical protein
MLSMPGTSLFNEKLTEYDFSSGKFSGNILEEEKINYLLLKEYADRNNATALS